MNLYAYRSPDPKVLTAVDDPVGPDNVRYLESWLGRSHAEVRWAIAAWGDKFPAHRPHPPVILMAERLLRPLYCMGRTKSGGPRHPSRLPDGVARQVFMHPAALR